MTTDERVIVELDGSGAVFPIGHYRLHGKILKVAPVENAWLVQLDEPLPPNDHGEQLSVVTVTEEEICVYEQRD